MHENSRNRLVIAFAVRVHAADAFVVPADDPRQLPVEIDVGTFQQQIRRRGEVRFVRPFGARQRARDKSDAEMLDLGVGMKESRMKLGYDRVLVGPDRRPGLS